MSNIPLMSLGVKLKRAMSQEAFYYDKTHGSGSAWAQRQDAGQRE